MHDSCKAFDPRFHAFVRWRIEDLLAICTSRKVYNYFKKTNQQYPTMARLEIFKRFRIIRIPTGTGHQWSRWSPWTSWNVPCPSDKLCLVPGRALSCSKQERKWNLAASSGANVDVTMSQQRIYKWVCLKIGYIPNYSHLIGIMIINHWV